MAINSLLRLIVACVALSAFGFTNSATAVDYRAKASGSWSSARTWRPRGVPGAGDRVVSVGRHTVTIDNAAASKIGTGTAAVAIVLDGPGGLVLAPGAQLHVGGHLRMTGEGANVRIGPSARLLFAPNAQQFLQLQMLGGKQRVEFAGQPAARGEIGLVDETIGGWFVASEGHRDSLLAGSYGKITGALDPENGKAWSMYLANDPQSSRLVASNMEFNNSGQVGVFGLEAGEFTEVAIEGWSFKASHPAAASVPALWFDGYGDLPVRAAASRVPKHIRNLVSDKEVYVRYVQDYELENWVLGANGKAGSVRSNNNGGHAKVQRELFQVVRDSGGVGLVADLTDTVYMYAETDNPHGFVTRDLRGDATLRNFWFESHYADQTDPGDVVLTNGPQLWVVEYGGSPTTLTVEHSGSIGDTSEAPIHPVFLTVNDGTGIKFRMRHNFMRQPVNFNAIALDENGVTPVGTGVEFSHNIVYSPQPVQGYAIGSSAGKTVVSANAFYGIDRNLYFNLQPREGYGPGVHAMRTAPGTDANSMTTDPVLTEPSRSLASWDKLLGGPGTAAHAIAELQKLNDDAGFDARYNVVALLSYIAAGYTPTDPGLLDGAGTPTVGPALAAP